MTVSLPALAIGDLLLPAHPLKGSLHLQEETSTTKVENTKREKKRKVS
jgi:hypothetical protein